MGRLSRVEIVLAKTKVIPLAETNNSQRNAMRMIDKMNFPAITLFLKLLYVLY